MQRTLFIHVGAHRTATTSIQRFMLRNFDALLANGCLLPLRKARHFEMMNNLFNGVRSVSDIADLLNERADSKETEITKLVLSDEDICMRRDLTLLQEFRDHFDVKIVYSMRRQDLWLESWYFQNIKWQWNPSLSHVTFDEFIDRREEFHWIHYDRYVRHLESLFDAENLLLSVFEPQQMPDGPVNGFCRQIGLDALVGAGAEPHVNSSMSAAMVEFTRHLPLDEFTPPERDLVRRALETVDRTCLGHDGKQSERLLPPDRRRALLDDYAAGNAALAQRYFGRDALFMQDLPDETAPLAELRLPGTAAELMETVVAPLFRQLVLDGAIKAPRKKHQ